MAKRKQKSGSSFLKILLFPLWLASAVVLPFFLLIRVSVFAYTSTDWNAWICLSIGALLTFILILIYLNRISKWFTGNKKKKNAGSGKFNFRLALLIVGGFMTYALFFISGQNAKTTEVRGEYATVHPLLRTAVGTILVFNPDAIITDMSRVPADYNDMGLSTKKNSLHYPQSDGYVHAIDFRTRGNSEWRNTALKWTFQALGFRTLRHVGSADHLHVSLMVHDNPSAL